MSLSGLYRRWRWIPDSISWLGVCKADAQIGHPMAYGHFYFSRGVAIIIERAMRLDMPGQIGACRPGITA